MRMLAFCLLTLSLPFGGFFVNGVEPSDSVKRMVKLQGVTSAVGLYETIEFKLTTPPTRGDPFDPSQINADLVLKTPSGAALVVPAFHMQEYERVRAGQHGRDRDWCYPVGLGCWRARFAPMETGTYEAELRWRDSEGEMVSGPLRFACRPSDRHGFLRTSKRDPRFLEFSDGRAFFGIGQNLAFVGDQQYVTVSKAEEIFALLEKNGANYLRIWTGCEDWALAIEARKSAWGRSWNWRPPIVSCPDNPLRRCVRLPGTGATLRAEPSHRVALRPNTRYVLSGTFMCEGNVAVWLAGPHAGSGRQLQATPSNRWTPFRHQFTTSANEFWLEPPTLRAEGDGTAWLDSLSLREAEGGPELLWETDVNRPVRGFYNPLDCFLLDELVAAADRTGIYLQLCLLTRDLYMSALKDPTSAEYDRAIADAKKFMRYAVARWGSATSVAAWEYWNELDPGLPTHRFYADLGRFLEETDIYQHLRTTSTWGPSPKDCSHPQLDIADTHFYLRPSDQPRLRDEVDAVLDRTRWLREQAPRKPAHLGEFGLANEKWQPTAEMGSSDSIVDFHNSLWASALSGASTTALFWWWDRLDKRGHYGEYGPLSRFVADVPWTTGALEAAQVASTSHNLRAVGLQSRNGVWLWLFDPRASWASVVSAGRRAQSLSGAVIEIEGLPEGAYRIEWFDTRKGLTTARQKMSSENNRVRLEAPSFTADIAVKVLPAE